MIRRSLALRVLAISFLVIALPLLIYSFIIFQRDYESASRDSQHHLKEIATYRALGLSELEPLRAVLIDELKTIFNLPVEIENMPNPQINAQLAKEAKIGKFYHLFILKNVKGRYLVVASSIESTMGQDYTDFVEYSQVLQKNYVNFMHYDLVNGALQPRFLVGSTIFNPSKTQLSGIIMVSAEIESQIAKLLETDFNFYPVNFALLTKEEVVYAASDSRLRTQLFRPLSPSERQSITSSQQFDGLKIPAVPLKVFRKPNDPFFQFEFDKSRQSAYQFDMPQLDISLVAYATTKDIFGQAIRRAVIIYLVYALIFLIGGALTYWLTIRMDRPWNFLRNIMQSVSQGDLKKRFKADSLGFEINELGLIFNDTIDSLLDKMHVAEEERLKKETLSKELEIGQEIQENLFPKKLPHIKDVEISTVYLTSDQVGGDFYDIFIPNEKEPDPLISIVIADASGKGISSCLYALGVRSLIRAYSRLYHSIPIILQKANHLFCQDTEETGMFMTLTLAQYSPKNKQLSYFSCGHVPTLLRKANGTIQRLQNTGLAMGLFEYGELKEETIALESGDALVFYTDGLRDMQNDKHQFYGEHQILQCLLQKKWQSADEIAKGLYQEVIEFSQNGVRDDDITIVVFKVI